MIRYMTAHNWKERNFCFKAHVMVISLLKPHLEEIMMCIDSRS